MSEPKAIYDYYDEHGKKLLFQVCRYEPGFDGEKKTFRQRRPDGKGGWINGLCEADGKLAVELVPYRLSEIIAKPEQPVLVVEGEKDVESLRKLGLLATTNPMGAGKWRMEFGRWLRNRRVAILPDQDQAGDNHAWQVAGNLLLWGVASVRVVRLVGLTPGADVTDWLSDGIESITPEQRKRSLVELIKATPEYVRMVRVAS